MSTRAPALVCGALVVVAALLGCRDKPKPPPPPPEPLEDPCVAARAALDAHVDATPRGCRTDQDCRSAYVRVDPCLAPVVASASWDPDTDAELARRQAAVRAACTMPSKPCEAELARPACRLGACVDDKGQSAVAIRGCAPDGRPALTVTFTDGQAASCDEAAFPSVSATIWGEVTDGQSYAMSPGRKSSSGVLMRCQDQERCSTGNGTVRIVRLAKDYVSVAFDAGFPEGEVKAHVEASFCPGTPTCARPP